MVETDRRMMIHPILHSCLLSTPGRDLQYILSVDSLSRSWNTRGFLYTYPFSRYSEQPHYSMGMERTVSSLLPLCCIGVLYPYFLLMANYE
jgi:hypothetical protein